MADRVSQLQDAVNMQAENFCNSIGILTQFSKPSFFPEFEKSASKSGQAVNGFSSGQPGGGEDYIHLFSQLIARTARDIDIIIDSLPSEESTPELQASHLKKLESDNRDAAQRLEETIKKGDKLLEQIQKAIQEVAEAPLSTSYE